METLVFSRFSLIESHEIGPLFFVIIFLWNLEFQLESDYNSFLVERVKVVSKWKIPSG